MTAPSKTKKVEVYCSDDGSCPFEDWFLSLNIAAAAKADKMISKVEKGLTKNIETAGDVYEIRDLTKGPGVRIYFQYDGTNIILLLIGGTKKSQSSDIKEASKLWKKYVNNNGSKRNLKR